MRRRLGEILEARFGDNYRIDIARAEGRMVPKELPNRRRPQNKAPQGKNEKATAAAEDVAAKPTARSARTSKPTRAAAKKSNVGADLKAVD